MASFSLAQDAPPAQVIPPIDGPVPETEFGNWHEIARTEFSATYEQPMTTAVPSGVPINDSYTIKAYVPFRSSPVPVVILLHYWGATDTQLEQGLAQMLNDRGIAAIIAPLPYHLTRTPAGYRSGELAIQPDLSKLVATMTQSVMDTRRVIDWIQTRKEFKSDAISVGGTSLGSLVAVMTFATDERIKSATFMLGGSDLAQILWRSSRVVEQRDSLRRQGYTLEKVREEIAPVEPGRFLKKEDTRPSFVIGARHDTVIPPDCTQLLIDQLGNPKTLWLETGHFGGVFVQNRLLRNIAKFYDDTLNDREFEAPNAFYAPTIRLGLNANGDSGLQVAGGIDVWRTGKNGEGFASALLTPRGVQGFVGYKLSKEFAIGASLTRKKTTWGIFWSIVL